MCGIVGILLADERSHANQLLFDALTALQHRGQGKINVLLMLARLIFQQLLITIAPLFHTQMLLASPHAVLAAFTLERTMGWSKMSSRLRTC
jgi:glutamine phosphoribosylpyrophosphate amidotransferase